MGSGVSTRFAAVVGELRTIVANAAADLSGATSLRDVFNLVANALCNEWMKWFGHSEWMWNFMYERFDYEHKMVDSSQHARYESIGQLLQQHPRAKTALSVLDVGCGTANGLAIWRASSRITSFTGIDLSADAIRRAREAYADDAGLVAEFAVSSMQDYVHTHSQCYDIVIFTESLYYIAQVDEAVAMVAKAWSMLHQGGWIIISMSVTHHSQKIWAKLSSALPELSFVTSQARSPQGNEWTLAHCEKPAAPAAAAGADAPITEAEVKELQGKWANAIKTISATYAKKGNYVQTAADAAGELYGHGHTDILFKPTKATENPFRLTGEDAMSYFVGAEAMNNDKFKGEDAGFAMNGGKGWKEVVFKNHQIQLNAETAIAMGSYDFTCATTGSVATMEYTFGYKRNKDGKARIFLHHMTPSGDTLGA